MPYKWWIKNFLLYIYAYLSLEDIEPLSVVVPHPDTTNKAPSGMDIAEDGKVTGAVSESKLSK